VKKSEKVRRKRSCEKGDFMLSFQREIPMENVWKRFFGENRIEK
jgi:hypothetical protein